jgi:antitoxin YefM
MPTETTYTALRENLASYLDQVTGDREAIIVKRRGQPDVAIIPADELAGLIETAHLMRSPANVRRLMESLAESRANDEKVSPGKPAKEALAELKNSLGL